MIFVVLVRVLVIVVVVFRGVAAVLVVMAVVVEVVGVLDINLRRKCQFSVWDGWLALTL